MSSGGLFSRRDNGESELEQHHRQNLHQTNFAGMQEDGSPDKEYLEELTKNELDESTVTLMQNLMTPDYLLSNLSEAEVNEIKWIARSIARKIKRMHPPEHSYLQGEIRECALDDPEDSLCALSPYEENLIDQAVLDFFTRLSRSKGGWQQDEISKQVRVSKTEDDSKSGGSKGLFGRLK